MVCPKMLAQSVSKTERLLGKTQCGTHVSAIIRGEKLPNSKALGDNCKELTPPSIIKQKGCRESH